MAILIACEESQAVTKAFRELGAEAYSCDLLPCSGGNLEWHIQGDVGKCLFEDWEMVIAFPPCTDLASSGARWFDKKARDGTQYESISFFMQFTKLKCKWAIENPIGIMSRIYRKPDQIIQPFWFGDPVKKSTCLWLHGLPKLEPTEVVDVPKVPRGRARITMVSKWEERIANTTKSKRASLRSKTFPGVARAMAEQWIKCLK
jgi:hypothetical protein